MAKVGLRVGFVLFAAWFAASSLRAEDKAAAPTSDAKVAESPVAAVAESAKESPPTTTHDPYDNSHKNAGPKLEDPSEWKSDLAICTLIVFLCLLALLSKFAWRPVLDGLEKREQGIAENIAAAQRSADKAAEQLRHYEARLAAATEEAKAIVAEARRDAESTKDRIVAEAQEAAGRERQRAIEDIGQAKNAALQELTQKSVDVAVSLAGRLIRQQLKPADHAQLIREVLSQFPSRN